MCIKLTSQGLKPGDIFTIYTSKGTMSSSWGFNKGKTYNSRFDNLGTTWKNFKRGVLKVKNFYEGTGNFGKSDNGFLNIGVIYSGEEFSVVTNDADSNVKSYHHRMPLVLEDNSVNDFLNGSLNIKILDETQIKLIK